MISQEVLKKLALKYQTTQQNIQREYVQHLFLSALFQQDHSEGVFFKGGTALKLVFGSPRFSEDLDFSANRLATADLEEAILSTLAEISRQGLVCDIQEANETSGGYYSRISIRIHQELVYLDFQVSQRKTGVSGEFITIPNDFIPIYGLMLLDRPQLIGEKIQAAIQRSKPRDFYDLYFLLRAGLMTKDEKDILVEIRSLLQKRASQINFSRELKTFLPVSQHTIINNFPAPLFFEIDRFIASA
jgi:predicted nucleotidyltransferase component of viral defense system